MKRSYQDLADELSPLIFEHVGSRITHQASGAAYIITDVSFREKDMVVQMTYTPVGSKFTGIVKFTRTIDEMDFGNRFLKG